MTQNRDKKILLLGASGGIGSSISSCLRQKGYTVISPSRKDLDLACKTSIDGYFARHAGDFYAVVHSAGYNVPKPLDTLCTEDVLLTGQVNCVSLFEVLKYVLPYMKKNGEGAIVAISSIYGYSARPGRLAYVTSKHALNGLIKSLAVELGSFNIRVNAVSPGYVDTALTRKNNDAATRERLITQIPLGRMASGAEIASAVCFLVGDESSYITGQNLLVDGGFMAGGFNK